MRPASLGEETLVLVLVSLQRNLLALPSYHFSAKNFYQADQYLCPVWNQTLYETNQTFFFSQTEFWQYFRCFCGNLTEQPVLKLLSHSFTSTQNPNERWCMRKGKLVGRKHSLHHTETLEACLHETPTDMTKSIWCVHRVGEKCHVTLSRHVFSFLYCPSDKWSIYLSECLCFSCCYDLSLALLPWYGAYSLWYWCLRYRCLSLSLEWLPSSASQLQDFKTEALKWPQKSM